MGKWVLVTFFLILSIVVAFGIFAITGVIDAPALFWQWGLKINWLEPHLQTYAIGLDSEAWISGQEAELQTHLEKLAKREADLAEQAKKLEEEAQLLEKRSNDLAKEMAAFKTEQAQYQNVARLAEIYMEMAPEESARILEKLDEPLILEILFAMDLREAAEILTKLPTTLAVSLSKKLGQASK